MKNKNELLFSYGTLQNVDVQLDSFSRELAGESDSLLGYKLEILEIKDRTQAGVTAKPNGLYFVDVDYPEFDLPKSPLGPTFLQFPE